MTRTRARYERVIYDEEQANPEHGIHFQGSWLNSVVEVAPRPFSVSRACGFDASTNRVLGRIAGILDVLNPVPAARPDPPEIKIVEIPEEEILQLPVRRLRRRINHTTRAA